MHKLLSKFSKICGLENNGVRDISASEAIAEMIEEQTNGSQSLANLLQYQIYDESTGIFYNDDKTGGFFFEVAPKIGYDPDLEKNLKLFFNDELPEGSFIQFLIVSSNNISRPLNIWKGKNIDVGDLANLQLFYREKMWLKRAKDFNTANEGILPRDFRTFICVSSKTNQKLTSTKEENAKLQKFYLKLKNKLKALELAPRDCNAEDLIEIGREIMQMEYSPETVGKYNIFNKLSDQIPRVGAIIDVYDEELKHKDTKLVSKLFGIKKYPESFSFADMVQLLGTEKRSIPARFVISYSVANCLGSVGTRKILTQADRTMKAAEQPYSRNNNTIKIEAQQWRDVLQQYNAEGEIFLKESMQVMITAKADEMEVAEENLKSIWNAKDWQLEVLSSIQMIALMGIMPMHQASFWKQLEYFMQTRIVMSSEVIAKLPIQGEWKGVSKSGILFSARRGQLLNWNPFERLNGDGNHNVVIAAPSGSGKSFLAQELVLSLLRDEVQVFVIDIGNSFKGQCQGVGGELIGFDAKTKISMNPFACLVNNTAKLKKALEMIDAGASKQEIAKKLNIDSKNIEQIKRGSGSMASSEQDTEDIELVELSDEEGNNPIYVTKDNLVYVKSLISVMCGVNGDAEGQGLIERMITELLVKEGENLDVTKLMLYMKKEANSNNNPDSKLLSRMANSLYPYTEKGINGRFFKKGKTATFKEVMTVFEFESVKNDEPLMSVILQVILMQITNQFLVGDRSRKFALVVDEAWCILDHAAEFLEKLARTVRKYGGSLIIIAQDVEVFDNSKGGRRSQAAVLDNSSWVLVGKPKSLEPFRNNKRFENIVPLIATISKTNNYAEWLISASGTAIVGRLSVDPASVGIYSTESSDYNFLESCENQNIHISEAIMMLVKEKYGLQAPDLVC